MPDRIIGTHFPGSRLLIVEDLAALAIQYKAIAARLGVQVSTAGTVAQARRQISDGPWHAALIDLNLPDGSGFEVLRAMRKAEPSCSVVVITAEDSLANAVKASDEGAFDFIEKPVEAERLLVTLRNALHASQLALQVASLQVEAPRQFEEFIGQSPQMQTVYRMIETVAASNAPICITGESGTGKELAAQAVHARSPRRHNRLMAINCAAIPQDLIESELFGHARGAFTGAVTDRQGVFVEADKGTLFLDEIAELDLGVQAKLLRVLQTGEVKRLGEDRTRVVDVRIVCATHRTLSEQVRNGLFREDLFYRLYVVPIDLPPLRARGGDVALIALDMLQRFSKEDQKKLHNFSPEAMAALCAHAWPGNVRELINVVRAVVALNDGETVELSMLPPAIQAAPVPGIVNPPAPLPPASLSGPQWFIEPETPPVALTPLAVHASFPAAIVAPTTTDRPHPRHVRPLERVEREAVDYALQAFGGNVAKAARALQVNPSTLYRKIQAWSQIESPSVTASAHLQA
ncbi:MAG: hypothetical protein RLZZ126_224 [Pseudomonadota bacterium]|jgi:two-component system repressor protein LuxO